MNVIVGQAGNVRDQTRTSSASPSSQGGGGGGGSFVWPGTDDETDPLCPLQSLFKDILVFSYCVKLVFPLPSAFRSFLSPSCSHGLTIRPSSAYNNEPLIVAGGGGGASYASGYRGVPGQDSTAGRAGYNGQSTVVIARTGSFWAQRNCVHRSKGAHDILPQQISEGCAMTGSSMGGSCLATCCDSAETNLPPSIYSLSLLGKA